MAAPTGEQSKGAKAARRQQQQPAHIIVKRHQQRLNLNFRLGPDRVGSEAGRAWLGLAWLICNSKPVSACLPWFVPFWGSETYVTNYKELDS